MYRTIHTNYTKVNFDIKPYLPFPIHDIKGWGTNFIIAGGFIHDIIHNIKPKDIDFWIFNKKGFVSLINFFSKYYKNCSYSIYPALIEINTPDCLYPIQLINSFCNIDKYMVVPNFDLDYVRCFFDGTDIYAFPDCIQSWYEKINRNIT